jgi:IMP cyclohydrolase
MAEAVSGKYPGRAIFVGIAANCEPVALYMLAGRNPTSRERLLRPYSCNSFDYVRTVSLSGKKDPILNYIAMIKPKNRDVLIGSNGTQTDNIYVAIETGSSLEDAVRDGLKMWKAEPDSSHTARIACAVGMHTAALGIIRFGEDEPSVREIDLNTISAGEFVGLSTYKIDTPDTDIPDYFKDGNEGWKMSLGGNGLGSPKEVLEELANRFAIRTNDYRVTWNDGTETPTLVGVVAAYAVSPSPPIPPFEIRNVLEPKP